MVCVAVWNLTLRIGREMGALCAPLRKKKSSAVPHFEAVAGLWSAPDYLRKGVIHKRVETVWFRPFSPIFTIYLTNCVLPISRDTNLTPKCSHSLQQFRCVLLLRTENVNVCVVCCRNIRMAKPLADYADRYARFQCPRSKGMSQLM